MAGDLLHLDDVAEFSLGADDLAAIRGALPRLPGRWTLVTESGDEGELYGRILPPWGSSRYSAFLLERDGPFVILTDNLSHLYGCAVECFPTAASAMDTVCAIVENHEGERRVGVA